MKRELVESLTQDFESFVHTTDDGLEFWMARDLQKLLGYDKWENFLKVITKAKVAAERAGNLANDHFPDVGKTIKMPKGAEKEVLDIMLTRYACYLIAQNGDPRKEQVAFAQNYFAVQTRKFEVLEKRMQDYERLIARHKLTETEKEFSGVIFEQTGNTKNFGLIRSKGDKALFGYTTQQMKKRLGVPESRALADFQPTILLKAKDFATEITIYNAKQNSLQSEEAISKEHTTNNRSVRDTLLSRGIVPEKIEAEEDIKKVARKLKAEEIKGTKTPKKLR